MTAAERSFDPRHARAEAWWPYVTLGARAIIMRHPERALSPQVLQEIHRATGVALEPGTLLDEDDRRFVQSQTDVD
ncbi:hypothetical protein [Microbacterium pumilum]|uniref:Uncharacterized protein n=1 Tax=Microbacterium pumilum TaxID=344165 RepID=A0ABP5DJX5_9MICO